MIRGSVESIKTPVGVTTLGNWRRSLFPEAAFALAIAAWALFLYWLALNRHESLVSAMGDLGNTENILWNTVNGAPFRLSVLNVSFLGAHFAPGILLWAPFYWLWQDTRSVLLLQAITIALGAVPAYLLARHLLGTGWLVVGAATVALVNPYGLFATLDTAHHDVLALPLFGLALYALETGRSKLLAVGVIATLALREDFGLAVAGLGISAFLLRRRHLGAALFGLGLAYTSVMVGLIIPAIGGRYHYGSINPELGDGPVGVIIGAFTNPLTTWRIVTESPRGDYLFWLFFPYLLMPLLRYQTLLSALPLLARNFLAAHPSRASISSHYTAAIAPSFALAFIGALGRLHRRDARLAVAGTLLVSLMLDGYGLLGLWGREVGLSERPWTGAYREAIALVPERVPLVATPRLGAYLSRRHDLWIFPEEYRHGVESSQVDWVEGDEAAWIAVDMADVPDAWGLTPADLEQRLHRDFPPDRYAEVFRSGTVIVLRRSTA